MGWCIFIWGYKREKGGQIVKKNFWGKNEKKGV